MPPLPAALRALAPPLALFAVGLVFNCAFLFTTGDPYAAVGADAEFYLAIAQALRDGRGYVDPKTFWPDVPTMGRPPGWPALLAVSLAAAPAADPDLVVRLTGAAVNASAGAACYPLARRLGLRPALSAASALLVVLNPHAPYLAQNGFPEPWFVLLGVAAARLLLAGPRGLYPAALLLGVSALVRPNFVLFPLCAADVGEAAVAALLFLLPPAAWAARNYAVSGHFPVLSTVRGETFYGGNNPLVESDLTYWGYWIMPDGVPGEVPKRELAARTDDAGVDAYYYEKGKSFVRENPLKMPRLVLGKLVRAFAPVPWNPSPASFLAFGYRALLYAVLLLTLPWWTRGLPALYLYYLAASFLSVLSTVVVFYGTPRFTFCLEVFLFAPAVLGAAGAWRAWRTGRTGARRAAA